MEATAFLIVSIRGCQRREARERPDAPGLADGYQEREANAA